MFRVIYYGIEFTFKDETNENVLNETNIVYDMSNVFHKEYIGQVNNKLDEKRCLKDRLREHARKISINSEEKPYREGLVFSKRVRVKILKRCLTPDETRMCEHETIIARRDQIAKNRGYNIPQNAAIIENTSQNIGTLKLSVIAEIIRKMIDKGLDDKQLSAHKRELRQIKRLLRQINA
jgi:hypothetical protein